MQAAGVCPADALLAPADFAMDLTSEIQTAFAVALWRKCRQGTYLAAWNSAHDELIAKIASMPEAEGPDGRMGQVAEALGEGERAGLFAWVAFLVNEVFAPHQRRIARELNSLAAAEEARLRERITCDQDRLSDAQAREILARARRQREPVDGGEKPPTPNADAGPVVPPCGGEGGAAEPRWTRFTPTRKNRPPIRDPDGLDGRRAELIARLEQDSRVHHGLR